MNNKEVWKDIINFEGYYQVSNLGKIRSLDRTIKCKRFGITYNKFMKGRILKPAIEGSGYNYVNLKKEGTTKNVKVHRMVAITFLNNVNNLLEVNHKDENKLNNNVNNLEWCTRSYNNTYGTKIERSVKNTDYSKRTKNTDYKKIARKTSKLVGQYDLNNNLIRKILTCDIEKELNYNKKVVCNCCSGQTSKAYGYRWKYLIKEKGIE